MNNDSPVKPDESLIRRVIALCSDRGASAELRRYWSPTTQYYAFSVLGRLGIEHPNSADAYTVALYAVNPLHKSTGYRVGQALRRFADKEDSFDAHVRRLLASSSLNEVANRLQRLLIRLEKERIVLNYNQLLWDLRKWHHNASDVKTAWGKDYWMSLNELEAVEG